MFIFTSLTWASIEIQTDQNKISNNFNLTSDGSYIKYEEPDVMKETGWMAGFSADYAARFPMHFVLGVDGHVGLGQVDYSSNGTGSVDNINDFLAEVRTTAGYDFYVKNNSRVTPFTGFGYRFLFDGLGGNISSTGAGGYDRESNYLYVPVGVKCLSSLNSEWSLGYTAEYDIFIQGLQKSKLGQALTGVDTLENDQENGYGVRGSIQIIKKNQRFNLLVEPFIRYWNIDQSELKSITYGGTPVGVVGFEPDNNSTEVGLKIGVVY